MNQQHKNTVDQSKLRFLTQKQLNNYYRELEVWGPARARLYLKGCITGGLLKSKIGNKSHRLTPNSVTDIVAKAGSVTIEKFMELADCSRMTAIKHLTMLLEQGVLTRHRKDQRSPYIYSPGNLQLLPKIQSI